MINENIDESKEIKQETIKSDLRLGNIHKMKDHPFKVKTDDEDMKELMESIKVHGVMTPIIVRPIRNPFAEFNQSTEPAYEIVSGHRRYTACLLLERKTIPAIIRPMSEEQAKLAMIDSNLQREKILPSEKAFAYKMKMEILSRQGDRSDLTSSQFETRLRSDEKIAADTGESRATVQRFIRLTYLRQEMLDLVDDGKIAMSPVVELSYLPQHAQIWLFNYMTANECTPSYSQAVKLHKLAIDKAITFEAMEAVMSVEKANQRETVKIPYEKLNRYFPRDYMPNDIVNAIVRILEERKQQSVPLPAKSDNKIDITAEIARRKAEREAVTQLSKPKSRDDSAR